MLVHDGELVLSEVLPGHLHGAEAIGVGAVPDLVPLVAHRPIDLPFLVVQVGKDGGGYRAFRLGHPATADDEERISGETFDQHKVKGGFGDWKQPRWQRRTEEVWRQNTAEVAAAVDRAVTRLDPALVVVAGDSQTRRCPGAASTRPSWVTTPASPWPGCSPRTGTTWRTWSGPTSGAGTTRPSPDSGPSSNAARTRGGTLDRDHAGSGGRGARDRSRAGGVCARPGRRAHRSRARAGERGFPAEWGTGGGAAPLAGRAVRAGLSRAGTPPPHGGRSTDERVPSGQLVPARTEPVACPGLEALRAWSSPVLGDRDGLPGATERRPDADRGELPLAAVRERPVLSGPDDAADPPRPADRRRRVGHGRPGHGGGVGPGVVDRSSVAHGRSLRCARCGEARVHRALTRLRDHGCGETGIGLAGVRLGDHRRRRFALDDGDRLPRLRDRRPNGDRGVDGQPGLAGVGERPVRAGHRDEVGATRPPDQDGRVSATDAGHRRVARAGVADGDQVLDRGRRRLRARRVRTVQGERRRGAGSGEQATGCDRCGQERRAGGLDVLSHGTSFVWGSGRSRTNPDVIGRRHPVCNM
ncbi:hypothetical protein HUN58_20090 [Curtobacterium sp. Csp1]|nr:hypothetical protein HUN58_20090 [Curtobacterium sp. Csp1]